MKAHWRFALLMGLAVAASGGEPKPPVCEKEILQQLNRWSPLRQWRLAASEPGMLLYLSPTPLLGEWLELGWNGQFVSLRRVSAERRSLAIYRAGACTVVPTSSRPHYSNSRMAASFTDQTLRSLLQKVPAGILYAWSPGMPLSIERVASIREAGRLLRLPVFYILDPHADRALARRTAEGNGLSAADLRPMESIELFNRGLLQHYPSALVFSRGKIRGTLIPGWKDQNTYVSWVLERMAE